MKFALRSYSSPKFHCGVKTSQNVCGSLHFILLYAIVLRGLPTVEHQSPSFHKATFQTFGLKRPRHTLTRIPAMNYNSRVRTSNLLSHLHFMAELHTSRDCNSVNRNHTQRVH